MRFKAAYITLAIITVLFTLMGTSCKKVQTLTTGGTLSFSNDTLKFDTVFTAAGSFTRGMLIYNTQSEAIVLSSVKMKNGNNSYFHINVDGFPGNTVNNLKIAPHDSIYVYATVNINPNDSLSPFLITDSLISTLNGKNYVVPFTAYGQNAHYMVADSLSTDVTWLTDKPYLVIHNFVVGPHGSLTIPRGCRVYMHQDAQMIVYNKITIGQSGTSTTDSVIFQGDRLDRVYFGYQGYPGEWGGLWMVPGSVANISHTIIENCGGSGAYYNYFTQPAALRVDTGAVLNMDHSIVRNSIGFGLLSWQGRCVVSNSLMQTTGGQALAIIQGGYDSITNCTFANYGGIAVTHTSTGTVAVLNYFNNGDNTWNPGNLDGTMQNCIVYGSLDSEIVCDSLGGATASFRMKNCLLKMGTVRESFVTYSNCIFNQDPLFKDQVNADFHIKTGSPAIGGGITVPGITDDLDGIARGANDIGCYQYH